MKSFVSGVFNLLLQQAKNEYNMRQFFIGAVLALLTLGLQTQAQDKVVREPAHPGKIYGEKVKEKGAIDIARLPALLAKNDGKMKTKIKAKVVDVCPKKGCWVNLYVNDSTTVFVKMKDYGFFVPMDIAGRTVVLDGVAYVEETSVEELRHYAEDAKKPQEEIDAITQPEESLRFTAKGIKVLD